jgi:hypothetical protein
MAELQKRAEDPDKIHFIVHFQRPGARLFSVYLEYTHYPPRSVRNNDFEITFVKWPSDIQLLWVVLTIPKDDYHLAEEAAKEAGLVIRESIPMVFGGAEGEQTFPMSSPSVYSLESNSKSKVYDGKSEEISEAETKAIQRIFEEDERKHRQELSDQGLTEGQIDQLMQEIHNE